MIAKRDWAWLSGLCGLVACSANDQLDDGNVPLTNAGGMQVAGGSAGMPGAGGTQVTPGGGGTAPTGGGRPGSGGASVGGMTGMTGGTPGVTGTGGTPGVTGTGGTTPTGGGTCCSDGDCLCHGPDPGGLTSSAGPFNAESYRISTGTVHYPTDADPPFAAVALCGGFTNTGPEMNSWGPFYASHGIVTVIVTTGGLDDPNLRGTKLLAAVEELKEENSAAGSPLSGKLAGRYGTSGYSMGGGGTTIASTNDPSLRTSVGLAAWAPVGAGIQVPTLLLCGASDGVAPCAMSQSSYSSIPDSTPKMMVTIAGTSHLNWFGPTDAGRGTSGETALAFQKVYLEGDERWKPYLLQSDGTVNTNIQ